MAKYEVGNEVKVAGMAEDCCVLGVYDNFDSVGEIDQKYKLSDAKGDSFDAYECNIHGLDVDQHEPGADPVNHPPHYTSHPSGIECIQITEHMGFNLGNALKYVWRADLKDNAVEDMQKAIFYLNREIAKRADPLTDIETALDLPAFLQRQAD